MKVMPQLKKHLTFLKFALVCCKYVRKAFDGSFTFRKTNFTEVVKL